MQETNSFKLWQWVLIFLPTIIGIVVIACDISQLGAGFFITLVSCQALIFWTALIHKLYE